LSSLHEAIAAEEARKKATKQAELRGPKTKRELDSLRAGEVELSELAEENENEGNKPLKKTGVVFEKSAKRAGELMKDKNVEAQVMDEAKKEDIERYNKEILEALNEDVEDFVKTEELSRIGTFKNGVDAVWRSSQKKYNFDFDKEGKITAIPVVLSMRSEGITFDNIDKETRDKLDSFVADFQKRHNTDVKVKFVGEY